MAQTNSTPKASFDTSSSVPILGKTSSRPVSPTSVNAGGNSNSGGFWSSIGKVLTNDKHEKHDRGGAEANNRSLSRGRDIASTGRGGAGNFVREESTSRTRVNRAEDGDERGRDVAPRDANRVTHAGRGGEGNIRSPSRDQAKEAAERAYEEDVLRKSREHREVYGVSHGRGGGGNIETSRSRSREPGSTVGRGGAGNLEHHIPQAHDLERLDEEERTTAQQEGKHHHHLFSHGRGGQGNLNPNEADLPHGTRVSAELSNHTGRGGQGNIV